MSVNQHYKSLLEAVSKYEDLLKDTSEEVFTRSPSSGGWSYSETFSHIFHANLASLIAVEKCVLGTGVVNTKPINWIVWMVLFFGRLPPGKFKVPQRLASTVRVISKEEASNLIVKFKNRLVAIKNQVDKAEKYQKVMHPRLGLLNAKQWFRFIEIHTHHHIHQLKRIYAKLQSEGYH